MNKSVMIGNKQVGAGHPVYIIGEIGINHNGDVEIAKDLIQTSSLRWYGCCQIPKTDPRNLCAERTTNTNAGYSLGLYQLS